MVWGITGFLGGGKSYTEVLMMLEHLRKGWPVCSNIWLFPEPTTKYLGSDYWKEIYKHIDLSCDIEIKDNSFGGKSKVVEKLNPDDDPFSWYQGDKRGTKNGVRSLVVIDEASEWLDSYLPGGAGRVARICSWLKHSDKLGQDVHLIIQNSKMLHKRAQQLCQRWIINTNMSSWKVPAFGCNVPPPWNKMILRREYETDCKTPTGESRWIAKESAIWDCYDTAATFGQSANLERKRGNVVIKKPQSDLAGICADLLLTALVLS